MPPVQAIKRMRNMRILWINTVGAMGGAERSLTELLPPLAAQGHDMAVACPHGTLAASAAAAGADVFPIPSVRLRRPSLRHTGWRTGWLSLPVARRKLAGIIRSHRPDILHANSLAAMLALPSRRGAPAIWHVRDLRLPPAAARLAARRADAIIAISTAVETRLSELLPTSEHAKIKLIPNGIALPDSATLPQREEARQRLGLPLGTPIIGMLAHFIPWKRHDRLIAAAALLAESYPQLHVVLAGGDPCGEHAAYVRHLREQIATTGLEKQVSLPGEMDQPLHFLGALDLLVHPAEDEPFGRVVCEAMAVGTPVVAVNRGGPATILEHEVTGWLVDRGTPDELAGAVKRLLDDDALRSRLAARAAARVRESYDIRVTAARISACYAALARRATATERGCGSSSRQ